MDEASAVVALAALLPQVMESFVDNETSIELRLLTTTKDKEIQRHFARNHFDDTLYITRFCL